MSKFLHWTLSLLAVKCDEKVKEVKTGQLFFYSEDFLASLAQREEKQK